MFNNCNAPVCWLALHLSSACCHIMLTGMVVLHAVVQAHPMVAVALP